MDRLNRRHPHHVLTTTKVRKLATPGRFADGGGLYLVCDPSGAKRWVLRTVVRGRRRDMGLGSVRTTSLAQARELAQEYRSVARRGDDPFEHRRKETAVIPSFEEAATTVHHGLVPTWKNSKHADQWIRTLQRFAYPVIGRRPINQVTSAEVLRVLTPIWTQKPETAKRVAQRIGTVIRWARANRYFSGDDPVSLALTALPKATRTVTHHAALPFVEIPALVRRLRESSAQPESKLALEFLILSASRTREVLLATWSEIDLEQGLWVLPAVRTKTGRAHRVPLTGRMVELLDAARELPRKSEFIFCNPRSGRALSYNTLLFVVQRRLKEKTTVHGLRSSFKDWAAETTNYGNEISEMALSHAISSDVEAAYRRGDLLEKRRGLMQAWTEFVCRTEDTVVTGAFTRRGSQHGG